ncbi:MAG: hypothetical protein IPO63_00665 [Bacteroidetes bacterium]|nr:hypothetical protein [Bacteroidota bacterium]
MKIKAYIHFPEDEIAFNHLAGNPDSYNEIVKGTIRYQVQTEEEFAIRTLLRLE